MAPQHARSVPGIRSTRVALVHDTLTERTGPGRVLLHLAACFDDPLIVTSVYAPEATFPEFARYRVKAVHELPRGEDRAEAGAFTSPGTFRSLDLRHVDLVIASTTAFAHHVRHRRTAVYWHGAPSHSPGFDPSAPEPSALVASPISTHPRDLEAATYHRLQMANSYRTAERLHATYGVEAGVLHPPLDSRWLDRPLADPAGSPSALVVSRLRPDKHVDVAIAACARLGVPLTVVGEGPDLRRLQDLAGPSVTFIASLSDAALAAAYGAHSVVLCPGRDDFGLVALEAGSAGRPVVASSTGAGMETVLHRETGWLVGGWHADDWAAAVGSVLQRRWDASALRNAARRFGVGAFDDQLARWLEPLVDPGPSRPAVHAHEPAGTASVPRALVTS